SGLGHIGVKLAASFEAEITVLSRSPHKKPDAESLGAHNFLLTSNPEEIEKFANYFDVIIDTVSAPHDLAQALGLLRREGTLVLVGASDKPIDLTPFPLIFNRRKILGSLIGGLPETQEMLDHCGKHNITCDIELISADKINESYERVLKSDVKYRFVIDCSTL
ncbi:MAG: zinc-binding dehydrogenase, partial [Bdellovibrionales bacterium]|nr:zinc-binding dehydrogenase [Bdellovibrionales bacterium]